MKESFAKEARGGRTGRSWRGPNLRIGLIALSWALIAGPSLSTAQEQGPIRRTPGSPSWPKDFEVGLQSAQAFARHFGTVEEDSLVSRLDRVGYSVASQTGHPEILFSFHIIDVPEPNALALPGGFVFVTKGMIDLHLPDAELAFLVGHEMAHVTEGHYGRAGRLNGAISLLQTAILVAAIFAVPSSSSGGYDRDPETGYYRTSLSGKDAAIQGTNIFGGVFKELLLRGYSRGLEMEADEVGRRYAGRAGYPMSGSMQLLEELHRRIYEDQEFGYWQTHPYFTDRIGRARAAVDAGGAPPAPSEIRSYREGIQRRLAKIAESIEDEPTALFLFRTALEADPEGESSFEVEQKLLSGRAERLHKRKPELRSYGPLVADYDSLLARLTDSPDGAALVPKISSAREDLDRERRELLEPSMEILKSRQAGTRFLELFLENYPDDPGSPEVRLRLAELYRLSDRPDAAALVLDGLSWKEIPKRSLRDSLSAAPQTFPSWKGPRGGSPQQDSVAAAWTARSTEGLRKVLPQTRELTTSQRILMSSPSDSVHSWARTRLGELAAHLDSLEVGSRFLEEYPVSEVSDQVREKVEALAMKRYYRARLRESMREFQDALDGYNELLILTPWTKAAGLSREGVARVQSLGNLE